MTPEVLEKRIWYWDVLRIAAMVFLVIRHSATATFEFVEPLSENWWVSNIYGTLAAWMVPVFMMISGAGFLNPERNITVKKIYQKNIFHMLCAFAFWSLFYALYNELTMQDIQDSFVEMLFGGHFHLWFLPMIVGMYILTPLLRSVANNKNALLSIVIVTFFIGIFIPTMQDLGLFFDSTIVTTEYHFGFLSPYVCFFFLGICLHRYTLPKPFRILLYFVGIISTLLIFGGTYYLTVRDGCHNEDMQADNNLFTALQGMAIFVFAKQKLSNVSWKTGTKEFVLRLSSLTFGVYMVHVVFLALLDKFGFSPISYPAVWMIPLLILFVLPVSFFCSLGLKKIPLIGRYII